MHDCVTEESDSSLDGGGNVRDEVFFLFAPVIASTTFRISAVVELNLDCDVGAG